VGLRLELLFLFFLFRRRFNDLLLLAFLLYRFLDFALLDLLRVVMLIFLALNWEKRNNIWVVIIQINLDIFGL